MKTQAFALVFFLIFLFSVHSLSAADLVTEHTIRDISLGGTTIGTNSQVSIAGQNNLQNQLFVGYRDKFSMKELAVVSVGGLYHSPFMTNVLTVFSAGYEDYRQTLVGLHAQKMLSERFSLGIAIQAFSISSIAFEKDLFRICPAIGVEYQVNQSLTLGINVLSPVNMNSEEPEQIKSELKLCGGASYRVGEMLLLASEYDWRESEGGNLKIGAEYALIPEFKVRAGMNSHPFSPTIGCGYLYQNFMLDVAAEQHRYLGTSLSVGLSYRF